MNAETLRKHLDRLRRVRTESNHAVFAANVRRFFDLEGGAEDGPDVFTTGEDVDLEEGDAVEVTFWNTIAKREDTHQGVIEELRGRGEDTTMVLSTGWSVQLSVEHGRRRIFDDNGRGRGHLSRPGLGVSKLFPRRGRGSQQTLGGDEIEIDDVETLIEDVERRRELIGDLNSMGDVDRELLAVAGQLFENPPSPFDDNIEDLQDVLRRLMNRAERWYKRHVSSLARSRRPRFEAIMEAVARNKPETREKAREFIDTFGD